MDYEGYDGLARALFEEHEDPLVLCDSQTKRVLDVNAAAQRLCGIGLKDLLDTPVLNLFRLSQVPELDAWPHPGRKLQLPFSEWGCQLRTAQPEVWVAVDVTVAQLAVRPGQLSLLTFRPVASSDD